MSIILNDINGLYRYCQCNGIDETRKADRNRPIVTACPG